MLPKDLRYFMQDMEQMRKRKRIFEEVWYGFIFYSIWIALLVAIFYSI